MGNPIPQQIVALQAAQVIPFQTTLTASVQTAQSGRAGSLNLSVNKTHNQMNVIGVVVRVNVTGTDNKYSENGNKIITDAQAAAMFLQISHGATQIIENIPLEKLVVGGVGSSLVYVPVYWKDYNPAYSNIIITTGVTFSEVRDVELILIHSEL